MRYGQLEMARERGGGGVLHCVLWNLDPSSYDADLDGLVVQPVSSACDISSILTRWEKKDCCITLGITRNLMPNYLALTSLLFSGDPVRVPVVVVAHPAFKIGEAKAFLFGKRPYPVQKLTACSLREMMEVARYGPRVFHRLRVEFVAFVLGRCPGEEVPVVCRNISWGGTFFETREDVDAKEFRLLLRSRFHRVELPCRLVSRRWITGPPGRHGYGVRFSIPLPLSLVHYMYAKHLKDREAASRSE